MPVVVSTYSSPEICFDGLSIDGDDGGGSDDEDNLAYTQIVVSLNKERLKVTLVYFRTGVFEESRGRPGACSIRVYIFAVVSRWSDGIMESDESQR